MEGLLNYAYYQAGALNSFDAVGHLLHFSLYDVTDGPVRQLLDRSRRDDRRARACPARAAAPPPNITNTAPCVSWLGPNQPGINEDLGLPPYNKAVCSDGITPDNAAARAICDPSGKTKATAAAVGNSTSGGSAAKNSATPGANGRAGGPAETAQAPESGSAPGGPLSGAGGQFNHLRDLLGLGDGTPAGGVAGQIKGLRDRLGGPGGAGRQRAAGRQ